MNDKPYDQPSKTYAIDGEVVIDGPDGVGVSVTPRAAKITSQRLAESAETAEAQQRGEAPKDDPFAEDDDSDPVPDADG